MITNAIQIQFRAPVIYTEMTGFSPACAPHLNMYLFTAFPEHSLTLPATCNIVSIVSNAMIKPNLKLSLKILLVEDLLWLKYRKPNDLKQAE